LFLFFQSWNDWQSRLDLVLGGRLIARWTATWRLNRGSIWTDCSSCAVNRDRRGLFLLDYIQNIELRKRIHADLNKGEARNALARAVFFNRLGELRDRTYENQQHPASGLNLVVAAIALWNTVYLERAIRALQERSYVCDQRPAKKIS
jgi:TnpA family transposase